MSKKHPALELRQISKRFGAVQANDRVSLVVQPGTIHGLIGENGAGKSTAAKMVYGLYRPDSGEIFVRGEARTWRTPADAIAAGIGMVHQHFMLAGPHTALDNVLTGAEPSPKWGCAFPRWLRPVDRASARQRLEEICRENAFQVDWDAPVETLSVGIQQRIEIVKLLFRNAELLILDEPTAVLTPQETQELFATLRRLRDQGKTILIITHKLKEVMAITDRVTVFRQGQVSGEVETRQANPEILAELMVGRKVQLHAAAPPPPKVGETVFELRGVTVHGDGGRNALQGVSLGVRSGEVVGIAGVEGNGQSELLRCVIRPEPWHQQKKLDGEVRLFGKPVQSWPTAKIRELGVGYVAEDRHHQGLILESPVEENFLLGRQRDPQFCSRKLLNRKEIRSAVRASMEEYDVRPRDPSVQIRGLSGGNQQKLIIARELLRKPRFFVAAQPTRGVDIGAIEFIHQQILAARTAGAAVLLVSSELDEILALSDRILVLYEGRVVAEYARGEADERVLGLKMGCGQ
jgi:general nucleoside transport system ATP-binding protein